MGGMGSNKTTIAKVEAFEVRDGDVLTVSFPEATLSVAPYSTVKVGGLVFQRQLRAGDDVNLEHDRIYAFLKRKAELIGREKVEHYLAELERARSR